MPGSRTIASVIRLTCLTLALLLWANTPELTAQSDAIEPAQFLTQDRQATLVPTRVQLQLFTDPVAATHSKVDAVHSRLRQILTNSWGNAVELEIFPADAVSGQLSADDFSQHTISPQERTDASWADTKIELRLEHDGTNWQVQPRRWLRLVGQWQPYPLQRFSNSELTADYLAASAAQMISPVVKLDQVTAETVTGLIISGEINPPDMTAKFFEPGDFLVMSLLYFDREKKLRARQPLPWTYLQVTNRNRSDLAARIISAFRSPVPKSRRRVELYAHRIGSTFPTTKLKILIRATPPRPYALTDVLLTAWETPAPTSQPDSSSNDEPAKSAEPAPHLAMFTNRDGLVELETSQLVSKLGPGLVKIEVLSAGEVVARLPWLPGSSQELEIAVPDDSARVNALQKLAQLEKRLLRQTAKRATLIAALNQIADANREIDPAPLFKELAGMPTQAEFEREVRQIRTPAVDELNELGNRTAARAVAKACDQTSALLVKHLTDEPLDELRARLDALSADSESNP